MKRLITVLFFTNILIGNTSALTACSNKSTINDDIEDTSSGIEVLDQEIKEKISEEILSPIDDQKDGYGYMTATLDEFGYSSGAELENEIGSYTLIKNDTFEEKIVQYLSNAKMQLIEQKLKQKYDVFRDQTNFLAINQISKISKEPLNLTEIKKILFKANENENESLSSVVLDNIGEVYKFNISFVVSYSLNNDLKTINQNLTFYLVSDRSKFNNIQELLTNYVEEKIKLLLKSFQLQLQVPIDGNKIISNDYINSVVANLLNKDLNIASENEVDKFKINNGFIWKVNNSQFLQNYKKITNVTDITIHDIYETLQNDSKQTVQKLFENKFKLVSENIANKEMKDDIKFEYDLISTTLYGYNLKKIYFDEVKIVVDYKKILENIKDDYRNIPTIIQLLFNNEYSKLERIKHSNKNKYLFKWNLKPYGDDEFVWDPAMCDEDCKVQSDNPFSEEWKMKSNYIIKEIVNAQIITDWFKSKILKEKLSYLHEKVSISITKSDINRPLIFFKEIKWDDGITRGSIFPNVLGFYQLIFKDIKGFVSYEYLNINIKINNVNVSIPLSKFYSRKEESSTDFQIIQDI